MLDVTEQLRRYGDVVAETVEPVPAAAVTVTTTETRRPRRPAWQALAPAAAVVVLLAGGVWFATRSSDSSPDQGVATGRAKIEVGVASVLIPDGMKLDQIGYVDPPGETSPVTGGDGKVTNGAIVRSVRARVSTVVGMCTITSYRGRSGLRWFNTLEDERYNAELLHLAQVRNDLETRIATLNQQIASEPRASDRLASLVSQREAAAQSLDNANQLAFTTTQAGPQRLSVGEGFTPTDASRTAWRAQATQTEAIQVTCPDPVTAQRLVDATTLPTHTP